MPPCRGANVGQVVPLGRGLRVDRHREVPDRRPVVRDEEQVILGIAARGGEIVPDLVGARPREPHLGDVDLIDQVGEVIGILRGCAARQEAIRHVERGHRRMIGRLSRQVDAT